MCRLYEPARSRRTDLSPASQWMRACEAMPQILHPYLSAVQLLHGWHSICTSYWLMWIFGLSKRKACLLYTGIDIHVSVWSITSHFMAFYCPFFRWYHSAVCPTRSLFLLIYLCVGCFWVISLLFYRFFIPKKNTPVACQLSWLLAKRALRT